MRRLVAVSTLGLNLAALTLLVLGRSDAAPLHIEYAGFDAQPLTDAAPFAVRERLDASAGVKRSRAQPDPAPLVSDHQYVFDLRYKNGDLILLGTREERLAAPIATARAFGRFALELYEGPALIERVRFDFPFLGAGVGVEDGGIFSAKKLTTRIGVLFPKTARGTHLVLVDRASLVSYPLPWPANLSDASSP
jgi:hypothetical protein